MQSIELWLDILPISSNHTKIPFLINGKPRLISSGKAKKEKIMLETEILYRYGRSLKEFFELFDRFKQELKVEFYFSLPNLYNKDGSHNSRIPDNTNIIKTIEDAIFKVAKANDRAATTTLIHKFKGGGPSARIVISIMERI